MKAITFIFLFSISLLYSAATNGVITEDIPNKPTKFDGYDFDEHFNCLYQSSGGGIWMCCGYVANGEYHCGEEGEWEIYQGKPRRCSTWNGYNADNLPRPGDDDYRDICCDSDMIDSCGGNCKAFYIWDFRDVSEVVDESGDPVPPVTLDLNWREQYLDQGLSTKDAYDNEVYPVGFAKGTLHYNNDPPVCVYIPAAAGRVIEIKVEVDGAGDDRLCVDDTHDDEADKNDPGQIKTCDGGRLTTCFSDSSDVQGKSGYAFIVNCDGSCEETSDVHLWFRGRFSEYGWADQGVDGNIHAEDNIEMWCEYVLRDYPDFDAFPSDLSPHKDPFVPKKSSSFVVGVLFSLLATAFYY